MANDKNVDEGLNAENLVLLILSFQRRISFIINNSVKNKDVIEELTNKYAFIAKFVNKKFSYNMELYSEIREVHNILSERYFTNKQLMRCDYKLTDIITKHLWHIIQSTKHIESFNKFVDVCHRFRNKPSNLSVNSDDLKDVDNSRNLIEGVTNVLGDYEYSTVNTKFTNAFTEYGKLLDLKEKLLENPYINYSMIFDVIVAIYYFDDAISNIKNSLEHIEKVFISLEMLLE